jgi:DnaJ-class molecular chaperone
MTILGKAVCPDCNGNGYVGPSNEPSNTRDCSTCNNQGEISITDESIDRLLNKLQSERLQ